MIHTRLWIAAAIIAVVLVAGFAFSVPHTQDGAVEASLSPATTSVPSVTLRDVFKKGTHTITGSFLAPNACTVVSAAAALLGDASSTESIRVDISLEDDEGVCLQLPTQESFSTTIAAPANLPLRATVNGEEATTTVL